MARLMLVAVALDQTQIIGITPKERFNPGDRVYPCAGNGVNGIDACGREPSQHSISKTTRPIWWDRPQISYSMLRATISSYRSE
jgi:hypothetical protein